MTRGEVLLRCINLIETRQLQRELARRNAELEGEVVARGEQLETERTDRGRLSASLDRLSGLVDSATSAKQICDELAALGRFERVALVGFGAAGRATVLGIHDPSGEQAGRRLGEATAHYLRGRAADGPWVEATNDGEHGRRLAEAGLQSAAYAPIIDGDQILGVLVAGSDSSRGAVELELSLPAVVAAAIMAGAMLGPALRPEPRLGEITASIQGVIADRAFSPVYQPIIELATGRAVGYEALTRFDDGVRPDLRFADADAAGTGIELELATLELALAAAADLPTEAWLSLNVSPGLVLEHERRLGDVLRGHTAAQIVLELNERHVAADRDQLRAAVDRLGEHVRFAVDDVGAGMSSLRHIVEMHPHLVKVDMDLIRGINDDPARRALVAAIAHVAREIGCALVAKGVETVAERDTLATLPVAFAQGYLLGRPAPIDAIGQR